MHVTITVISLKSLNNAAVLSLALLDLLEMSYASLIERIVLSQNLIKKCCFFIGICHRTLPSTLINIIMVIDR